LDYNSNQHFSWNCDIFAIKLNYLNALLFLLLSSHFSARFRSLFSKVSLFGFPLLRRAFSSTIFKMVARLEKTLAKAGSCGTKSLKKLGDFNHVKFWEDQDKMAAKVVFKIYLRTWKCYAQDSDDFLER